MQSNPTHQVHSQLAQEYYPHPFQDFQTSKIQFFSSSSILDEISLDDYQINYSQKIIKLQVDMIFRTLQNELTLLPSVQSRQKLDAIINRANILCKSTIADFFAQTKHSSIDPKPFIIQSQQKLKQLIDDYHSYQKESISYEDFYRIYKQKGKQSESKPRNMLKKEQKVQEVRFDFVEKVQIVYTEKPSYEKRITKNHKGQNIQSQVKGNNEKKKAFHDKQENGEKFYEQIEKLKQQNKQLNQEIHLLKLKLTRVKQCHQKQIQQVRQLFCQRLQNIIELKLVSWSDLQPIHYESKNSLSYPTQKRYQSTERIELMEEIGNLSKDLNQEISKHKVTCSKLSELVEQINALRSQNTQMKQGVRQKLEDKQLQLEKLNQDKRNQNLIQQIKILKKQIQSQRDKVHRFYLKKSHQKDWQIHRLKQNLETLSKENRALLFELDKLKISKALADQNYLKSQQNNKLLKLSIENSHQQLLTLRNSKLQSHYVNTFDKTGLSFQPQKSQSLSNNSPLKSYFSYQIQPSSKSNSFKIAPFLSDVLEGFVYFQCLQRQFKFRYLRACLRQKELLYKNKGFEVGVVSKLIQVKSQTKINFAFYLTNSSQDQINNLKLKIINSNGKNEVYFKTNNSDQACLNNNDKAYCLKPGDQIKVPIQISVWSYPLGTVSLLISGLAEQLRLLLPFSIVKLFTFVQTSIDKEDIKRNSWFMSIKCETRVMKTLNWLLQGLLCKSTAKSSICNNQIGLVGYHEQSETRTKMWLEYDSQKELLEVWYFKEIGNLDLVDYLMKSLRLIVQKENK